MTPQRVALAGLAGLIAAAGVSDLAAGRAATPARTPEPTLQTFRMAEVELIGCRGVAMPRSARGRRPAEAPLLAAWSLERRWGVMRSNGRLQRFNLGRSSRETDAEAGPGLPPRWRLPWPWAASMWNCASPASRWDRSAGVGPACCASAPGPPATAMPWPCGWR
ncbi:MAG: hypothetical protein ACKO25_04010, partial [Cyanobium sp.]